MGSKAPSPPDPTTAAIAGLEQQSANYPFSYDINSAAQTGQKVTLTNPATGQPQTYDFTGLGTADVQNQVSGQMAQVLLDIQNGLGSQFIAQRLADLKQSDPTGYAAYGQLFDQITQEAAQNPPDLPLSQATQDSINGILKGSTSLTPSEQTQVQQEGNASNVGTGIFLGNAPAEATGTLAVNAVDQKQNQAEAAASQYLQQGTTPSDIQYRKIQQDLANYGAFINGQNPTAQFSSLSGAQQQGAPNPATGYTPPTLSESQGVAQGLNNANQGFAYQNQLANGEANPYLAGLNIGLTGLGTAANIYNSSNTGPASNYSSLNSSLATNPFYMGGLSNTNLPGSDPISPTQTSQIAGEASGYATP